MEIAKWSQIGSSLEVTVSADVDSDKTEVRLTSLGMPYCSMSGRVVSGQALFENVTAGMHVLEVWINGELMETKKIIIK